MYTSKLLHAAVAINNTATVAPRNLASAAAFYGSYIVMRKCQLSRLLGCVTTAVAASVTPPVVSIYARPTPGSSSGQVLIGTLSFPNLQGVGSVLYKDISPVELVPGTEIALDHSTQAVDGSSAAGAALIGFELDDVPESADDSSNMVLSA
jgi:hypothetical protein